MCRRMVVIGGCLMFALGAFVYGGPTQPGPLNPFGLLFLGLTILAWRKWGIITGHYSPALFDGFTTGLVDRVGTEDHRR